MRKYSLIIPILALFFVLLPINAHAITIEISGNGENSNNEISVTVQKETHIEQSNTSNTQNETSVHETTGKNTISDTTGDKNTSVNTGNIENTTIVETNNNHSSASTSCCNNQAENIVKITDNGANSQSNIEYNKHNTTSVTIQNTSSSSTISHTTAVTGKNTVKESNSNVSINTGDIKISESITRKENITSVEIEDPNEETNIKISGNGIKSKNNITINSVNTVSSKIEQSSVSHHFSYFDLMTGENKVEGINKDVSIDTGDISIGSNIASAINTSTTEITCCPNPTTPPISPPYPTPTPTPTPTPPSNIVFSPQNQSNLSEDGENIGGVDTSFQGQVLGTAVLPATGLGWWAYATIANTLMLILGIYLRRKAGRSPGYAKTI